MKSVLPVANDKEESSYLKHMGIASVHGHAIIHGVSTFARSLTQSHAKQVFGIILYRPWALELTKTKKEKEKKDARF